MRVSATIFILALTQVLLGQPITQKTILYSRIVGDSFEIYISKPANIDPAKTYDVIYYCDANLKSGKKLRQLMADKKYASKTARTIFVGIGHIGNFHVLRRRDYILPDIKNGDTIGHSRNYGQIENFYQFLKTELIPSIEAAYPVNKDNNSIIGHSLGGLFAFYCLFKNETLFKNYFALSPALWIDHYTIYKFNKLGKGPLKAKQLYFSTGGLEILNHIRTGTHRMDKFLDSKYYSNLTYTYQIHKGKTHNSQVEKSLDYILRLD